jgi:hypothetical protein
MESRSIAVAVVSGIAVVTWQSTGLSQPFATQHRVYRRFVKTRQIRNSITSVIMHHTYQHLCHTARNVEQTLPCNNTC